MNAKEIAERWAHERSECGAGRLPLSQDDMTSLVALLERVHSYGVRDSADYIQGRAAGATELAGELRRWGGNYPRCHEGLSQKRGSTP